MRAEVTQIHTYSVQGIHCSQCLKKLKALKNKVLGLEDIVIDMSQQLLEARTLGGFNSKNLINEVEKLGFKTKEIFLDKEIRTTNKKKKNKLLSRVGVSGALAGNIMLLSYATYLGAPERFSNAFTLISGLIYLPVLLYAAQPFFISSFTAVKNRQPSIDLPLALAIFFGSSLSYINLLLMNQNVYFDSLASLVFLILASRYIVQRFQMEYLSPVSIQDILPIENFTLIRDGGKVSVTTEGINKGDQFFLKRNQIVPTDSIVIGEEACVDNSLITGEADEVQLTKWSKVFAGAMCLSEKVHLQSVATQKESRVSSIIQQLNQSLDKDSSLIKITDSFANYFTVTVFSIGTLFFLAYSFVNMNEAINRVLALFVIACPCAIAVTTPIVLRLTSKEFIGKNFLIKKVDVFERLNRCRSIVFDKTGTLTLSNNEKEFWFPRKPNKEETLIIYNLEKSSEHPLAESIIKNLGPFEPEDIELESFEEVSGWGVKGSIGNTRYSLRKVEDEESSVGFFKNDELISRFNYKSRIRPEVADEMALLKKQGVDIYLLTGDGEANAKLVASQASIKESHVFFDVSPENKNEIVKELAVKGNLAYVGDGLNDSLAMSSGMVGISMKRSVESTFKTSDIHILKDGIRGLSQLFEESKKVVRNIKKLVLMSFVYNALFGSLALAGLISPLLASVLMPLSSLSLLSFGVYVSKEGKP